MNEFVEPNIGVRFLLHGSQFEVTFVMHGTVRYTANAGGRQYRLPYEDFLDLQRQGTISVIDDGVKAISDSVAPTLVRKHRYVEGALRQLTHPTAVKPLKIVIGQVAVALGDSSPPAVSSVAQWIRKYQQSGSRGLIGYASSGNRTIRLGIEVERLVAEAIKLIYLRREKHSAKDVRDHVVGRLADMGLFAADQTDTRVPTLRTIQRRLKQLDPYLVARAQRGEEAANRLLRAAGRSIKAHAILSIVEADTHTLDVMIIDPDTKEVLGRPFLTCMIDVHTRAVVGTHVSLFPPSAITALAAFKDMLTRHGRGLPGGVPAQLCPDNGVEFRNSAFSRLCEALSVTLTPSQVREPNGKPHIERFFGTITNDLVQKLSGTTFSNPKQRGDYDSSKQACFSLADVRSFINEWIDGYHRAVHTRTGRAPICAWEEQIKILPPLTISEIDVNALARRPVQRSIVHGRVRCAGLEYFSPALATIEAQGKERVTVLVDDLDLNSVLVQHPEKKDILIQADSVDPDYTVGLTSYEHAESMRIKKAMSANDRAKLGHQANSIARWELLQRIHSCNRASKMQIRKITAGLGSKTQVQKLLTQSNTMAASPAYEERGLEQSLALTSQPPSDASAGSLQPTKNTGPEIKYESFILPLE
ncbi:MAG TPA: Mu transposase C-terminal domain-containing protein [Telluria sp.]|jgi:putative transposase